MAHPSLGISQLQLVLLPSFHTTQWLILRSGNFEVNSPLIVCPTIQPADFGPSLHQKSASGSSIIAFGPAILQNPVTHPSMKSLVWLIKPLGECHTYGYLLQVFGGGLLHGSLASAIP